MSESPNNKNWNVMVYMAADNSLSEESIFSLKEMQRVGTVDEVEVLVQFHSSAKGAKPKRYPIRKQSPNNGKPGTLPEPRIGDDDGKLELFEEDVPIPDKSPKRLGLNKSILADPNGIDPAIEAELLSASNPAVLEDFLLKGIANSPTSDSRQIVILSGHGSGAVGPFLQSDNPAAAFKVTELKAIFQSVKAKLNNRKVDIILMDSCVMSMAEVAFELSEFADILIGAEGFELATGWPYHRILESLNAASQRANEAELSAVAQELVGKYVRYYMDYDRGGVSVDQSACDLKQTGRLVVAFTVLAKALSTGIKGKKRTAVLNSVLLAHWQAQSYRGDRYVDLWDFCDQLGKYPTNKEIKDACRGVIEVIDEKSKQPNPFVLRSCYSGAAFQHSHGVSIYFPWAADTEDVEQFMELKDYRELQFSIETGWGNFIKDFLEATRRPVRNDEHLKEKELRCFIPTDETRVGLRIINPGSKGDSGIGSKVKNPPVAFFRKNCS